jgi:hypothetical protein
MFGDVYLKLIHALQNPQVVIFTALDRVRAPQPEVTPANFEVCLPRYWEHEFKIRPAAYLFTNNAGDISGGWSEPSFLLEAWHLAENSIVLDSRFFTIAEVQDILGTGEVLVEESSDESDEEIAAPLTHWADDALMGHLIENGKLPPGSKWHGAPLEEIDEVECAAAVFEALDAPCRATLLGDDECEASMSPLFKWGHSTGAFASWNEGELYELVKIMAVPPLSDWLAERGLVRSQSFDVNKFQFEDIMVMIEFWAYKMRWIYTNSLEVPPDEELHGTAALAGYIENRAVSLLFMAGNERACLRIRQIRDMVPCL